MRAVIVEDNEGALKALKRDLNDFCPQVNIVAHAGSVEEAIQVFKNNTFELVFLDVNLPDGTCFDLLQRINYSEFKIIFTSAYDKYAISAFRFSAVDYLLKPIKIDELKQAVEKIISVETKEQTRIDTLLDNAKQLNSPKKIALNNSDGTYVVDIADIIYVEAYGNYANVYVNNREKPLLISKTLKHFDQLFKSRGFIRTHHSYVVNTDYIMKYVSKDGGYIILKNGENIPISQRKKVDVIEFIESLS